MLSVNLNFITEHIRTKTSAYNTKIDPALDFPKITPVPFWQRTDCQRRRGLTQFKQKCAYRINTTTHKKSLVRKANLPFKTREPDHRFMSGVLARASSTDGSRFTQQPEIPPLKKRKLRLKLASFSSGMSPVVLTNNYSILKLFELITVMGWEWTHNL